ncbi:hypothetical protein ACWGPW_25470 [Paenibacillus chitinolyticus]
MAADFRKMFKKDKTIMENKTYKVFPLSLFNIETSNNTNRCLIICISFSCMHCINLLPNISSITKNYNEQIVMITDGSFEQNEEIRGYFNFEFKIISVDEHYLKDFGIEHFPHYMLMEKEEIIKRSYGEELEEFLDTVMSKGRE